MADYEEYKLRYEFLAKGRKEIAGAKRDRINKAWAGEGPTTMTDRWKQEGKKRTRIDVVNIASVSNKGIVWTAGVCWI